jgi:hypothetical protein
MFLLHVVESGRYPSDECFGEMFVDGEREGESGRWRVRGGKGFWRWRGRGQVTDGMFKEGRWRREKYRF